MTDTRQLEFVAVELPTSDACRKADCDGHIEWLVGNEFPKCSQCSQPYCFGGVRDARPSDAQTIAMLEGVVEAAKRGAARGAGGKPGKIAEAVDDRSGWWRLDVCGVSTNRWLSKSKAESTSATINARYDDRENTDAKTIADFEAEVKTLSATIVKQTRQLARRILSPAPPDDSREAFEAWMANRWTHHSFDRQVGDDGRYRDVKVEDAYDAWLAALAWRGSKTMKIAWGGGASVVLAVGSASFVMESEMFAKSLMDAINKAHGCEEATDGN